MIKPIYEYTEDGGVEFKFIPEKSIELPIISDIINAPEISVENPLLSISKEKLFSIENEDEREVLECALAACSDYVWNQNGTPIRSANPLILLQNALNALIDMQFEDTLTDSVSMKPIFNFREDGSFGFSSQILDMDDMRILFRARYALKEILDDESLTDKQREFIKMVFPSKHTDVITTIMFAIQNLWEYYDKYGALSD